MNSDKINFDMDTAMPCGMLITEVISNAFKYAFPDNRTGTIFFRLKKHDENKITISVADDGVGLPPGFQIGKSDSLGMQLIIAFTNQIDGELTISGEVGTKISVTFTYPKNL
jgi:two-component sensor histidine kinase